MEFSPSAFNQATRNVRLFIAFRVLFNARFYYPVFAILFLDFGLTMEQFALLNVAWAVAIVGLEVPSGALADQIGRKPMVVAATCLMVFEMALLCFVPLGNTTVVFVVFLINRILSGAAEASASGADEALAYDSLVAEGRAKEWPGVLATLMRCQSAGFVVAMIVGSALYDPTLMQRVTEWIKADVPLNQETTMRFPLYLNLAAALLACLATFAMKEPPTSRSVAVAPTLRSTITVTLKAGRWILRTPLASILILAGVLLDSMIRLFLTIGSKYYRLIELPEASFGLIGAGFAMVGFLAAPLARRLASERTFRFNFTLLAALVTISMFGVSFVWPVYGLVYVIPLAFAMSFLHFFLSHYLNEMVDSTQRATVLSFRGVAMNLAYGGIGLLFAALMRGIKIAKEIEGPPSDELADVVFAEALQWFPWYFLATMVALAVFAKWRLRV